MALRNELKLETTLALWFQRQRFYGVDVQVAVASFTRGGLFCFFSESEFMNSFSHQENRAANHPRSFRLLLSFDSHSSFPITNLVQSFLLLFHRESTT